MLGSPCNPCCDPCATCSACPDEFKQVVVTFTAPSGSGTILDDTTIVCTASDVSVVIDAENKCCYLSVTYEYGDSEVSYTYDPSLLPPRPGLPEAPRGADGKTLPAGRLGEISQFEFGLFFGRATPYGTWPEGLIEGLFATEAVSMGRAINLSQNNGLTGPQGLTPISRTPSQINDEIALFGKLNRRLRERIKLLRFRDREPPILEISFGGGSGAVVKPVLSQQADQLGKPFWILSSVEVLDGGGGYSHPLQYLVQCTNGGGILPRLSAVIENGKIISLSSADNAMYGLSGFHVTRTRSIPTVKAVPPAATTGMDLTVTLTQTGSGNLAYWSVSAVTVLDDGDGWQENDAVTFIVTGNISANGEDAVTQTPAVAYLVFERIAPTVTAEIDDEGGTGATLSVALVGDKATLETWSVESVSVSGTTSGYTDRSPVTFTKTDQTHLHSLPAEAHILTQKLEPVVSLTVDSQTGSGAQLLATLSEIQDPAETYVYAPAWGVSSITIDDPGEGYESGDVVLLTIDDGQKSAADGTDFYALVYEVGDNGEILSLTTYNAGAYFKSTGQIASVVVEFVGQYYSLQLTGVNVFSGGAYYLQAFQRTETPIQPGNCKDYASWETYWEIDVGTEIGERWVEDGLGVAWPSIRRCSMGTMEISIE